MKQMTPVAPTTTPGAMWGPNQPWLPIILLWTNEKSGFPGKALLPKCTVSSEMQICHLFSFGTNSGKQLADVVKLLAKKSTGGGFQVSSPEYLAIKAVREPYPCLLAASYCRLRSQSR